MCSPSQDINFPPNTFSHVFVNFGIFILPTSTLAKCHSVLRPNGAIGISTWSSIDWVEVLGRAVARLPSPRPYAPTISEVEEMFYKGNHWNLPSWVGEQLKDAGFKDVEV